MNTLFDMIRNAQGGNGMDQLAQQFGLQQNQVQSALESLLPAFSMGLEKQAQNPASMFDMFGKAAQGGYANMFEQGASQQETTSAGNDILGSLFGSKDMSRAVAQQAEAASGISSTILKAMLPVIASMVMGGVMKNMFNGQGGMLGGLLSSMFGGGNAQQAGLNPAGGQGGLGDLLGQMMGGAQQNPTSGGMPGGLGDLLGQMMGGGQAQSAPQANPMDMFGDMFKSGAKAQQTHMDGLQSIFDQFMKR
jgi:hypothetical protein